MAITNVSKPTTSLVNPTKVVNYETWDSNTSTWDTETRTWDEMGTIWSNIAVPSFSNLRHGLVAYWKMDETTGNAVDSIGGNTGVNTDVTYASSKINNGAVFNGSTSVFNITDTSSLKPTRFTLSAWVKVVDVSSAPVLVQSFSLNPNQAGFRLVVRSTTGYVRLKIGKNTGNTADVDVKDLDGDVAVNDGLWHLICGTYDGAKMKVYVDGTLDVEADWFSDPVFSTPNYISIGAGYNSATLIQPLTGSLDEVGIWNRALTQTEITDLYNSTNGIQYPFSLIANIAKP